MLHQEKTFLSYGKEGSFSFRSQADHTLNLLLLFGGNFSSNIDFFYIVCYNYYVYLYLHARARAGRKP